MKKRLMYKAGVLLLSIALLASFAGCQNNNTPDTDTQSVTLDYTVKTDLVYANDVGPDPFINGYARFYDRGTKEEPHKFDYHYGNEWNYIDAKGNVLFNTPYHEITYFNQDGLAVAKQLYYTDEEIQMELATKYCIINTQNEIVETLADETTFKTKYYEFVSVEDTSFLEHSQTNSQGYKVEIKENETDGKTNHQYCVLNPKGKIVHVLSQNEAGGSIRFLTDNLIVCGFGQGNFGNGDYFKVYTVDGKQVSDTQFDLIGNFDNGYVPFILNRKLGLLDGQGEISVKPCIAVDDMRRLNLHENKIIIKDNDCIGIVEIKEAANMQVSVVADFTVDLGLLSPITNNFTPVYHIEKHGFMYANQHGELLPEVYNMAYPFENGKALVNIESEQWFYINEKGEKLEKGQRPGNPATTEIHSENELFFVEQEGKKLTEPIFSWIESVIDDLNFAQLAEGEHKNVMIDPKGNILATLPDDCIGATKKGDNLVLRFEKGYQLADLKGKVLNQTYFTSIGGFNNGLAAFTLDGKVGLIAKDGNVKIEPTLTMDAIVPAYGEGKIVGALHGKFTVITVTP